VDGVKADADACHKQATFSASPFPPRLNSVHTHPSVQGKVAEVLRAHALANG